MTIQTIPLNHLIPSSANVRKTGASGGIDELAASIAAHGLLQNLQVRSSAKGRFEVVAGGRRLAALKMLAKHKEIAKDFEVPCHVLDGEDAHEISLAENVIRLAMHPADQFTAFLGLTEQGKGAEEIAARFGVSVAVVRQRLKLASVSPRLIEVYRDDEMSLDQLMAFAVSDDHAAQEATWFDVPDYNRHPSDIRAHLTAAQIEARDRRVTFVSLSAYLDAGGSMNRDLFQPEHEGYLTNPALLDRLVAERLEQEAETLRAKGWKWIEVVPRRAYGDRRDYGRVYPTSQPLPDGKQQRRNDLMASYDALIAEHGDEPDDETAAQLETLWEEIEAIDASAFSWRDEDRANAGVVISIGHSGELGVEEGLVHPDDRTREPTGSGDEQPRGVSARLIKSLTAERTAALRATMIDDHKVALAALSHALALPVFYGVAERDGSCLNLRLVSRDLHHSAEWIEGSGAHVLVNARQADWQERLPDESADLFGWLLDQEMAVLIALLSFCAAVSIDAVRGKQDRESERLIHADQVAAALGLDMTLWWSPTKESYLGKVPKALILEAVKEGVSPQAAENLSTLKRDRLIETAVERLSNKGWLPTVLRSPKPEGEAIDYEAMAAE